MLQVPTPVDSKVLQYLITRCSLLLRAYATTMDRDQELLKEIMVKMNEDLDMKFITPSHPRTAVSPGITSS